MAAFQDRTGTPVLPTVDEEGNVPVAFAERDEASDSRLRLLTLRELRRITLLLAMMQGIPATALNLDSVPELVDVTF